MAAAHTITREVRAEMEAKLDPGLAAEITVPVLLLTGESSSDPSKPEIEAVAAALPDARIDVIGGQEHVADILVPRSSPITSFRSSVTRADVHRFTAWGLRR